MSSDAAETKKKIKIHFHGFMHLKSSSSIEFSVLKVLPFLLFACVLLYLD